MILSEKQIEMYSNCTFLNEGLFNRKPKQEPNLTQQEFNELLKQIKEIINTVYARIKNSRLYGQYYKSDIDRKYKKIEDVIGNLDKNLTDLKSKFDKGEVIHKNYIYTITLFQLYNESSDAWKNLNIIEKDLKNLVPSGFYLEKKEELDSGNFFTFVNKKFPLIKLCFDYSGHQTSIDLTKSYILKKN